MPSLVMKRKSTPSPLMMSRLTADFIALVTRSRASFTVKPSLYPCSSTPRAISAPEPTAAYLSGITEPSTSST